LKNATVFSKSSSLTFHLLQVFFFAPIPEVTDADMAFQAEQCSDLTGYEDKPIRKQYKLLLGVVGQFCYVGAQVAVASQFVRYSEESFPSIWVSEKF
jgi:FHS family L-fucose permease-like MFS transporter